MEYWLIKDRCIFCDIVSQDAESRRLVYENDNFVVLEPFASRLPFETWIYPKDHAPVFQSITDSALVSLADAVKETLQAIGTALSDPPYHMILHSGPVQAEKRYSTERARVQDFYHWHVEIIPRATRASGFEYGAGSTSTPFCPRMLPSSCERSSTKREQRLKTCRWPDGSCWRDPSAGAPDQ